MTPLKRSQIEAYRTHTYRLSPERRIRTREQAVRFVEERGFVCFWPIKGVPLPNLWSAVSGDRPVASEHDDPGHVTWGWKDEMLGERRWFYAKILRGKSTMISLDVVPYFYALSENYGDPDEDYLLQYQEGRLSRSARLIYEKILREGPLDTVSLRRAIRMTGSASNSPFQRGLVELQKDLKLLPVGVARTGAWRYSFRYEIVARHFPEIPEKARSISRSEARDELTALYLRSLGAATERDVRKQFQWKTRAAREALARLADAGRALPDLRVEGLDEPVFAVSALLE